MYCYCCYYYCWFYLFVSLLGVPSRKEVEGGIEIEEEEYVPLEEQSPTEATEPIVHLSPWRIDQPNCGVYIFSKKPPVATFNHHLGDANIGVSLLWEAPTEDDLTVGLKDMAWVLDKDSKFSIDPHSPKIHPQLTQFTLEPKSVDLPLKLNEDETGIGYRHYESKLFDVVQVQKVPKEDKQ